MSKYPIIWVACPPRREGQPGKTICRKPWARNRVFTEEPQAVELTPQIRSSVYRLIHQGCLKQVAPPQADVAMTSAPRKVSVPRSAVRDLPPPVTEPEEQS